CACFSLAVRLPPSSPLFPYTTLFRSGQPMRIDVAVECRLQFGERGGHRIQAQSLLVDLAERRGAQGRVATDQGERGLHQCSGLRSEEHTSELQSRENLVCRLLLEKKK